MDLFDPTQSLLSAAMTGASARQGALASNLANANTAGYRREDVDFHGALRAAWAAAGDGQESVPAMSFRPETDGAAVMRADGSTVDVDNEAAQLAANGLEYEALVSVAKARIDIIQSAIGQ
jgi:flagellar basal-body rod protein FlgB